MYEMLSEWTRDYVHAIIEMLKFSCIDCRLFRNKTIVWTDLNYAIFYLCYLLLSWFNKLWIESPIYFTSHLFLGTSKLNMRWFKSTSQSLTI